MNVWSKKSGREIGKKRTLCNQKFITDQKLLTAERK